MSDPVRTDVAIVGAGFSGMAVAIDLDRAGRRDWLILEAADEVGGTWRDNIYPGAACDIPSHVYSYSFAPSDWTERYASQPEIRAYAVDVSHRFGLRDRIRFGCAVEQARWLEDQRVWELRDGRGQIVHARALVGAIGGLREPSYPVIPGRDDFAGPSMHTARWDPSVSLAGARIGVIGTGASAIQVAPAVAKEAASVHVFQRTAPWLVRRGNRPYSRTTRWAFAHVPAARRAHRARLYLAHEVKYLMFGPLRAALGPVAHWLTRSHLNRQVGDPALRERLTPPYAVGCKRVLVDDAYYAAAARGAITVEDTPIDRVVADGIRLRGGREVPLDVLVYATGFDVRRPLGRLEVIGRDGRDLEAWWGRRPRAYLGITIPGFPNFFMMTGPNTGLGHNSVIFTIESTLPYLRGALTRVGRGDVLDVKTSALDAWQAEIDDRTSRTVWQPDCKSWYLDADGKNFALWPGSTLEYRLRTRRFDARPYAID